MLLDLIRIDLIRIGLSYKDCSYMIHRFDFTVLVIGCTTSKKWRKATYLAGMSIL